MSDICKEYAAALFDLAKEGGKEEKYLSELICIEKVFSENEDYLKVLRLPNVSLEEKESLLESAFSSADKYVLNFIKLLNKNHVLESLPDICEEYRKEFDSEHGLLRALAVSAVELTEGEREKIKAKLQSITGKEIVLDTKVDESILGGVILRYDDKEIDGSIKARLRKMRAELKE
ncbi:MAG: F0F1 ATP synthase subunit delta [Clostridia bacterium]|nr:F0F1 ATP synthase subunit delta [Clostridia bacterium]